MAVSIANEGYVFVAIAAVLAVIGFVLAAILGHWTIWVVSYLMVVLALAMAFFFRDPERPGPRGTDLVLAPADGRVVAVAEVDEPDFMETDATRVSIFLSLFDVHVQRSPVAGRVRYRAYRPGRFKAAWAEEASVVNEQASIGIDTGEFRVLVRQIAGLVAQRIVTYVEERDAVQQGGRIGLIRFGSRVDIFLPPGFELHVDPGDRVRAGQTIMAKRAPARAPAERGAP